MLISPGVQLVERKDHESGVFNILNLTNSRPGIIAYTIDTFFRQDIASTDGVLKAIIDYMEIPEWYGYALDEVIVSAIPPTISVCIVVIVLRPNLHGIIHDPLFLRTLTNTHNLARARQRQFQAMVFLDPIIQARSHV